MLRVRKHMAESVTYVDGRELRYDAATNEIHRKYNMWVANLIGDINRAIMAIL